MNEQLTVLAWLKARSGMEETVKQELLALVEPVRFEGTKRGLLNYDQHQDPQDRTRFFLYENWLSRKHYDDYHANRPAALKAFLAKGEEILAEPPRSTFWQMISEDAHDEQ